MTLMPPQIAGRGAPHIVKPPLLFLEPDPGGQVFGVVLAGVVTIERSGLVADDAGRAIRFGRIDAMGLHIRLGPGHEEGSDTMHRMKADEIDIAAIHDVDGTGFGEQQVERMDVGHFAVRDMDEARDVALQIAQGVHLHRSFGRGEMRPRKDRRLQTPVVTLPGAEEPTSKKENSIPVSIRLVHTIKIIRKFSNQPG